MGELSGCARSSLHGLQIKVCFKGNMMNRIPTSRTNETALVALIISVLMTEISKSVAVGEHTKITKSSSISDERVRCKSSDMALEIVVLNRTLANHCMPTAGKLLAERTDRGIPAPIHNISVVAGQEFTIIARQNKGLEVKVDIIKDSSRQKKEFMLENAVIQEMGSIQFIPTLSSLYRISISISAARLKSFSALNMAIQVTAGSTDPKQSMILYLDTQQGDGGSLKLLESDAIVSVDYMSPISMTSFFPHCMQRRCFFVQCKRLDAYGNTIQRSVIGDVVSIDMLGVPSAMHSEQDQFGYVDVISDGSREKFETYQQGNVSGPILGNTTCNTDICPFSNVVTPDKPFQTWILVSLNGMPVGRGNPFLIAVRVGSFHNFGAEHSSVRGSVIPEGAEIHLFPVDAGGNRIFNLWDSEKCADSCARLAQGNASMIQVIHQCFVDETASQSVIVNEAHDPSEPIRFVFRPLNNCFKNSLCDELSANWLALGCSSCSDDFAQQNSSSNCQLCPEIQSKLHNCSFGCEWISGIEQALVSRIETTRSAVCFLNITFRGMPIMVSSSDFFQGVPINPATILLTIAPSIPSQLHSSLHEWNISLLSSRINRLTATPDISSSIQLALILRDRFDNIISGTEKRVRAFLYSAYSEMELDPPVFNSTFKASKIQCIVTLSGEYKLEIYFLPFLYALPFPPLDVSVQPSFPQAKNTVIIVRPERVIASTFNTFYMQARDRFGNLVKSTDPFFQKETHGKKATGFAPGFRIWAVKTSSIYLGSRELKLLSSLKDSIRGCPDDCGGIDPGFGSLQAAFRPADLGRYLVKVQFCDPIVHEGGGGCLNIFDLTLLDPPEAPNPCTDLPTGAPSSRHELACDITDSRFEVYAGPDRITRTSIMIESFVLGQSCNITILPADRHGRNAALPSTMCRYTIEFSETQSGDCNYIPEKWAFEFFFTPIIAGMYSVSVFIDEVLTSDSPVRKILPPSIESFNGSLSTAVGAGIKEARAGTSNSFEIHLRDRFGNLIPRSYFQPTLGSPYPEDCGYAFSTLQDGQPTIGYGLSDAASYGPQSGCRFAFHVYVVDSLGLILRPARGFTVINIRPTPSGTVLITYTLAEAGLHEMYVRFLAYPNAGLILHGDSGYLSLQAKNTSREGQIHGSPFKILVHPHYSAADKSRIVGLESGTLGGALSAVGSGFDVLTRDQFFNPVECNANELDVVISNPSRILVQNIRITGGTSVIPECNVAFQTAVIGKHELFGKHEIIIRIREKEMPGSPFTPTVVAREGAILQRNSFARLITARTGLPCVEQMNTTYVSICTPEVRAGEMFFVRISARDSFNNTPKDASTFFYVSLAEADSKTTETYRTTRSRQGEHFVSLHLTMSGQYRISAMLQSSRLTFTPFLQSFATLQVHSSGYMDARASLLSGIGLSSATAGTYGRFQIFPRDKYGNRYRFPAHDIDPIEHLPGRGIFQVKLEGEKGNTILAGVKQTDIYSFAVSYLVTISDQYSLYVTMLDEPPKVPKPSPLAVTKLGIFSENTESYSGYVRGKDISTAIQPFVVFAAPDVAVATGGNNSVCRGGSSVSWVDMHPDNVVVGELFVLAIEFRDACGNPSSAVGNEVILNFINNAETVQFSAVAGEATDLRMKFSLSSSGLYTLQVFLSTTMIQSSFKHILASPSNITHASSSEIRDLMTSHPIPRDRIRFLIQAKDKFGNNRSSGWDSFEISLIAVDSDTRAQGQSAYKVDSTDLLNGLYAVSIYELKSSGDHLLTIKYSGAHIGKSPYKLQIVGGDICPDHTIGFFDFHPSMQAPHFLASSTHLHVFASGNAFFRLAGRDEVGIPSRRGLDKLQFSLVNDVLKDSKCSHELDIKNSTLSSCADTVYGRFCDSAKPKGPTSACHGFTFEVLQDEIDFVSSRFTITNNSSCRSISGDDSANIVFSNTIERVVTTTIPVAVYNASTNSTTYSFQTKLDMELHPVEKYNITDCQMRCLQYSCSCLTLIASSGTYADGSCFVFKNAAFLQHPSKTISLQGYITATPDVIHVQGWYERKSVGDIGVMFSINMVGQSMLFVRLNGINIMGSPYRVTVVAGLFEFSVSSLWVTDRIGKNVTLQENISRNETVQMFQVIAGNNYLLYILPRDRAGNSIFLDEWNSQMDIKLLVTSVAGSDKFNQSYDMVWLAASTLRTGLVVNLSGICSISVIWDSARYLSSKNLSVLASIPCTDLEPNTTACVVPCGIRVRIPPDCHGNVISILPAILSYVFDPNLKAYVKAEFTDSSKFHFTVQGQLSFYDFQITKAGKYKFVVSMAASNFISIHSIAASPGSFDSNASRILWSGAGWNGGIINVASTTLLFITTVDKYDNPTVCASFGMNVTVSFRVPPASIFTPQTSRYFACGLKFCVPALIESGSTEMPSCLVKYWPAVNVSYHVEVTFLNQSVISKDVKVLSKMAKPVNVSAKCSSIGFGSLGDGVAVPCTSLHDLIVAGSLLQLTIYSSDEFGIVASFPGELNVVIHFCDLVSDLERKCTNPENPSVYLMNYTNIGVYDALIRITASGRYFISVMANDSLLDVNFQFNVSAGASDLRHVEISGAGLTMAVLEYPNTFVIEDKDSFGNTRVLPFGNRLPQDSPFVIIISMGNVSVFANVVEHSIVSGDRTYGTGKHSVTYTLAGPNLSAPSGLQCESFSEVGLLKVLCNDDILFSGPLHLHCVHTYIPGYAAIEPALLSNERIFYAGWSLSFRIISKDQLHFEVPSTFESIFVTASNSTLSYALHRNDASSSIVNVLFTASGIFSVFVLDGMVHIRGSPFQVQVFPNDPIPSSCRIFGHGLAASFMNETTTLHGEVFDRFGNPATGSGSQMSVLLSHVQGLEQIQTDILFHTLYNIITYQANFAGTYIVKVYVKGVPATGGILDNGISQEEILLVGNEISVLTYQTHPEACFALGKGLTLSTAGDVATFSIFSRDLFAKPRSYGNDVFLANIYGPSNVSCAVRNVKYKHVNNSDSNDEYLLTYQATVSGIYYLSVMAMGRHIRGSPFKIIVHFGEVSASNSELLQDQPTRYYYSIINLIPVSATASVTDGSFVRQVGNNTFKLNLRDKYGNQAQYNVSASCCNHKKEQFNILPRISAIVIPQVVKAAGNGFVMADVGDYIELNNVSNVNHSTNVSNVSKSRSSSLFKPSSSNLTVRHSPSGFFEIEFLCTAAGKYRLHVFVNGQQIARHVSIEEMQSSGSNFTISLPDCCVPLTEPCPASNTAVSVCGDLLTFIPSSIDAENTVVVGSSSKEFRFYVDGDGEGNRQYPVVNILARDAFSNVITSSNMEFLVTIVDMNGSTIVKQPAISVQPSNPEILCRTSVLSQNCGTFQYSWSSSSASKSGLYRIHVTFKGTNIGGNSTYITVRSREADSKTAQIFGPGIHVALFNQRTYFFFRVFDLFSNPWEPDCCLLSKPGPVNVDFGTPTSFGLNRGQRLLLNSTTADNRTRLIYLGLGLFKVEYVATGPIGPGSGNIQFFYGQSILAKTRPLKGFIPTTLEGSYIENSPAALYPVAKLSFATGSALYDHDAGDTVDLFIHAMSGLQSDPTLREGWWPALLDTPGKYFVVEVQGPPGTSALRFTPVRESGEFPWRFHVSWTPTVSGDYSIFVEYDSLPVQGDSSTDYKSMPSSPWQVRVHSAPLAPSESGLLGQGISYATVGEVSTFLIICKDIFGNELKPENFNRFKESEKLNGTLLGAWGMSVPIRIQSLGDGTYLASYTLTRTGSYAMNVMMNGIAVRVPPKIIYSYPAKLSSVTSFWRMLSSDFDAQQCSLFPSAGGDGVPCVEDRPAGKLHVLNVELRDKMNNSFIGYTEARSIVSVKLEGLENNKTKSILHSPDASLFFSFVYTAAGSYQVSVFIGNRHLYGSPIVLTVVPSRIYAPNCYLSGEGLFSSIVMLQSVVIVHGRDLYGNAQSLSDSVIDASVFLEENHDLIADVSLDMSYLVAIKYTPFRVGTYRIIVKVINTQTTRTVHGSGSLTTARWQQAPIALRASLSTSGSAIFVVFDQQTDAGCVHKRIHSLCNATASLYHGDCSFYFSPETIQLLGCLNSVQQSLHSASFSLTMSSCECRWVSSQELRIDLGVSASVVPGQYLHFLPAIRNQNGSSEFVKGSIYLDSPWRIASPRVVLDVSFDSCSCSALKISAEKSWGGMGHSIQYFWSVHSATAGNGRQRSRFVQKPDRLKLQLESNLIHNAPIVVSVFAYNFHGAHAFFTTSVSKNLCDEKILVDIDGGIEIRIFRNQILEIDARISRGLCYNDTGTMFFSWSLVSRLSLSTLTFSGSNLRIPANTLAAGGSYLWQLSVFNGTGSKSKGAHGTVLVMHNALRALIVGGNCTIPSQSSVVIIDATMSTDPDNAPYPMSFAWTCRPVISIKDNLSSELITADLPCFFDVDGSLARNSSILNLTGKLTAGIFLCSHCLSGVYQFTVNISKQPAHRWATATTVLRVLNEAYTTPVASVLPSLDMLVDSQSRLKLEGLDSSGNDASVLHYEWTIVSEHNICCSGFLNMSDRSLFPLGTAARYIIIKPGSLTPGAAYIFRFIVRHAIEKYSSMADLYVKVKSSPQSGKVSVYPAEGTSAESVFNISCELWTDDIDAMPLQYEYKFVYSEANDQRGEIPLDISFRSQKLWILPATPRLQVGFYVVYIRNMQGSETRTAVQVSVRPPLFGSADIILETANLSLTVDLEQAIQILRYDFIFQHFDKALSVLNLLQVGDDLPLNNIVERRMLNSISKRISDIRTTSFKAITSIFQITDFSSAIMINRMVISIRYLTASSRLSHEFFKDTLNLIATLLAHSINLGHENIQIAQVASECLVNLVNSFATTVKLAPSRQNLDRISLLMGQASDLLQKISQLSINSRLPGDEYVSIWTELFEMNTARIFVQDLTGKIFTVRSVLPSQQISRRLRPHCAAYNFPGDMVDARIAMYKVKDGAFLYGMNPYPKTVYDPEERFPKSKISSTFISISKLNFGPVPQSQSSALKIAFVDLQIVEWSKNPFVIEEQNRTRSNLASHSTGTLSSFICSSSFLDCQASGRVCKPPVVDGKHAPAYRDMSCYNAFDEDEETSWAVNPSEIEKSDGTGTQIWLSFDRVFTWSVFRYKQRKGPHFCKGSAGITCSQSSENCTCINGGDRELQLTFNDGSSQTIELDNTYDLQEFDLTPVASDKVLITVMSVYSNSKTCVSRSICAWWNPTCADWCPNGAAAIEFVSTTPLVQVYNYNFSYSLNYSLAAALISKVTSVSFRQHAHELQMYQLQTPIQVALRAEANNYTTVSSNRTLVCCKTFNKNSGRWSLQGIIGSELQRQRDADGTFYHVCHVYYPTSLSLVLIENPTAALPMYYFIPQILSLAQNAQYLPCAFLVIFIHFLVCLTVWCNIIWKETLAWKAREIKKMRVERQPARTAHSLKHIKVSSIPGQSGLNFPIPALLHSRIIAGQHQDQEAIFILWLHKSLCCWHYLYTCYWQEDDHINTFHRAMSFMSLMIAAFAVNCPLLSTITITTSHWYVASFQTALVLCPLAQILPAIFRSISSENQILEQEKSGKPQLMSRLAIPSSSAAFGKTRVKHLKAVLGQEVINTIKDNCASSQEQIDGVDNVGFTARSDTARSMKISSEQAVKISNVKSRTLKFFLKNRVHNSNTQGYPENSEPLSATVSVSEVQGFWGGKPGFIGPTVERVSPLPVRGQEESIVTQTAGLHFGTQGILSTDSLRQEAALHMAKEPARYSVNFESHSEATFQANEFQPPSPPPKRAETPPKPPPGLPPVKLSVAGERMLWRGLRLQELEQEVPFFESWLRKNVFNFITIVGDKDWSRESRHRVPCLLPKKNLHLAYVIWVFWYICCCVLIHTYSIHYDNEMGTLWTISSILALCIELLIFQTVLSLGHAWWTCSDGKAAVIHALHCWSSERVDLLPSYG